MTNKKRLGRFALRIASDLADLVAICIGIGIVCGVGFVVMWGAGEAVGYFAQPWLAPDEPRWLSGIVVLWGAIVIFALVMAVKGAALDLWCWLHAHWINAEDDR